MDEFDLTPELSLAVGARLALCRQEVLRRVHQQLIAGFEWRARAMLGREMLESVARVMGISPTEQELAAQADVEARAKAESNGTSFRKTRQALRKKRK
jgi:hypothetical protein